jgi:putative hemolysin
VAQAVARLAAGPPLTVAWDQPLESVLAALKQRHASLALVRDARGRVAGLLSVEDLVEELVGEIHDESDPGAVRESLVCNGARTLAELAEQGLALPGEPELTLASFLAAALDDELAVGQGWAGGGTRLVIEGLDAEGAVDRVRVDFNLAGGAP